MKHFNMIIRASFLLLLLSCVQTRDFFIDEYSAYAANDPSVYTGSLKLRKRDVATQQTNDNKADIVTQKDVVEKPKSESVPNTLGASEGGGANPLPGANSTKPETSEVGKKLVTESGKCVSIYKGEGLKEESTPLAKT